MRTAKLSMEEALRAEKDVDDRRQNRAKGINLRSIRDQGGTRLSNGVFMRWPAPDEVVYLGDDMTVGDHKITSLRIVNNIPEGSFALEVDGREIRFDTEEFKKYLRWA